MYILEYYSITSSWITKGLFSSLFSNLGGYKNTSGEPRSRATIFVQGHSHGTGTVKPQLTGSLRSNIMRTRDWLVLTTLPPFTSRLKVPKLVFFPCAYLFPSVTASEPSGIFSFPNFSNVAKNVAGHYAIQFPPPHRIHNSVRI